MLAAMKYTVKNVDCTDPCIFSLIQTNCLATLPMNICTTMWTNVLHG